MGITTNKAKFTALLLLSLGSSNAFAPNQGQGQGQLNRNVKHSLISMSAKKPSGSFFNQVPEKSDDDDDDEEQANIVSAPIDPFEQSLQQLMSSKSQGTVHFAGLILLYPCYHECVVLTHPIIYATIQDLESRQLHPK